MVATAVAVATSDSMDSEAVEAGLDPPLAEAMDVASGKLSAPGIASTASTGRVRLRQWFGREWWRWQAVESVGVVWE